MKKLIFFLLFPLVIIFAADDYSGVYLDANKKHSNNSSVIIEDLPDARDFDEIIFNFDLIFKNRLKYGNILHLFLGGDKVISIVFSTYKLDNKDGFIISSSYYSFSEIIHINKDEIFNKTSSFSLSLKSNQLSFSINKSKFSNKISIKQDELNPAKIIFGATPMKPEVTDFILKRFSIEYKYKTKTDSLRWTFNKFRDRICYDQTGRVEAELINAATPLVDRHFYWKEKEAEIIGLPKSKINLISNLTFDAKNLIHYYVIDNTLFVDSLFGDTVKTIKLKENLPFSEGGLIKDNYRNRLLHFHHGLESEVSSYDFEKNEWSKIDSTIHGTNFYNSTRFISPFDSMLYSIGGYGHYMFKNTLQRYNPKKKIWEQVLTSGDVITPMVAVGIISFNDSIIFLGGGIGSRTGDQRFEVKKFSSLYSLNLKNFKTEYLGEIYPMHDDQDIRIWFITYRKEENSVYFYTTFTDDTKSFNLQLYKYDLASRKRTPIGDLFINSEYSLDGLVFSEKTDEVFLNVSKNLNNDKTENRFFVIKLPAVTKTVHDLYFEAAPNKYITILAPVIVAALVIAFVWFRKKKNQVFTPAEKVILRNRLQLLDEFSLFDKDGNNIAVSFSSKTLEAFLLILLKSFKFNTHISNGGISSVDFANTLWPDYDKDSQKNNRNVTINKIRRILEKTDGLEVIYENSSWKIRVSDNFSVDLFTLNDILTAKDKDKFIHFIHNNRIGEFCKNISYEWFDAYKYKIDKYLVESIIELYKINADKLSPEETYKIAGSVLSIDELCESGLSLSLHANKLKKDDRAFISDYEKYKKRFFEITGEEYKKNREDLEKI